MTIDALPTVPSTASPTTFASDMDTFLAALPTFRTQFNAAVAALNSLSSGAAVGIPYTFSTTTADADPGAGYLRLDNATQNLATTIRADLAGSDGTTYTDVLATLDDSTSTVKGHILLQALADPAKWILFTISALASPAGYKNLTVAVVGASAASPFANGDSIVLKFSRTGDKGSDATLGGTAASTVDLLTGANIASAATVDLDTATGNRVHITGTTQIDAVTLTRGPRTVIFDDALTLAHHATNNNLPGGANITTAAGDRAIYESDGTTVRCIAYTKASGLPVVSSPSGLVLLATASASASAAVDFTSGIDSTYDEYELHLQNVIPATDAQHLYLRTSTDGGSTFDAGVSDYVYAATSFNSQGNTVTDNASGAAQVKLTVSTVTVRNIAGNSGFSGVIRLVRPAEAAVCQAHWQGGYSYGSGDLITVRGMATRVAAANVDALRVLAASGNIASGEFKLYGLRKAV